MFEYEAPKDDNYKDFDTTRQFFRRYFILFPFAAYALYNMMFVQKNKISRRYEWKLVSHTFESQIIGPYVSKKILKYFDGKVFKNDTEEV